MRWKYERAEPFSRLDCREWLIQYLRSENSLALFQEETQIPLGAAGRASSVKICQNKHAELPAVEIL